MKRSNLDAWICEVEGIPHLTRKLLEQIQLDKLNTVLKRVHQRQGHYSDYPEELSSLQEIEKLPFTTAAQLADHSGSFLVTSQSQVQRVISGATSGTTGPAKRVFYTASDTDYTVGLFAAGIGEMIGVGEKVLIEFPFSGPFGLGDLIAKAVQKLGAVPIEGSVGRSWKDLLNVLRREKPIAYIGFPIPLLGLVRMAGNENTIQKALVSGDACPPGVMNALEQLLHSKLFPHYGSREMGLGGAITCPAHEGMHLRENHVFAEIIDPSGKVLPDGQWGELVITTIGLEAMPLIRYRTGDRARFYQESCPCGSVTRRLDNVSRIESTPLTMEALDSLLFSIPDLIDYHAERCGDQLRLRLFSLYNDISEAALQIVHRAFPFISVSLSEHKAQLTDRPCYSGKRYIQTK